MKLLYLDDTFKKSIWSNEKYDKTQKKMKTLILKGLHIYFPPNIELFLDVKWNMDILEKSKKVKTKTGIPFATDL